MDFSWRFDSWYRRLPASPKDGGRVHAIVRRPAGERGLREILDRASITPEDGLVGDKWKTDPEGQPGSAIALINVHLLRDLTGGDEARMAQSGDNLQVDLDLSEENLPVGTRLAIGELVLEISDVVHRPCADFAERFGATAAKKVARALRMGLRGRGVLCRVVEAGDIEVGAAIRVERPSAAR